VRENTSGLKLVECLKCGHVFNVMKIFPLYNSSCPHCKAVGSKWLRLYKATKQQQLPNPAAAHSND